MDSAHVGELTEEQISELSSAFSLLDTAKEGRIPAASVFSVLEALGFPIHDQKINSVIQSYYTRNQDLEGKVSKDVFINGMKALAHGAISDPSLPSMTPPASPAKPERVTVSDLERQVIESKIKIDALAAKVDFAQRQLKEAERINTKVTADYVKAVEEIDSLKKQMRTVDLLRERNKALSEELEGAKAEAQELRTDDADQRRQTQRLMQERAQNQAIVTSLSEQLSAARQEKEQLAARMTQLQALSGEKKQLADQIAFLQEKLQAAAHERDSMSGLVRTLKEVNSRLEQRLDETQRAHAEALSAAQLQQQQQQTQIASTAGAGSLLDELSSNAADDRLRQLQQEFDAARTAASNQIEHLSSRLKLMESELAAAKAQATQMISLQQEQELKQKLSAEISARDSLQRAFQQLQEEAQKHKADFDRVTAENLLLKAAKQGEQELEKQLKELEERYQDAKRELRNVTHENKTIRDELKKANDKLNELDDQGKGETDKEERQLMAPSQPVFQKFLWCLWCPVTADDAPRRSRRARVQQMQEVTDF